MEEVWKPLPPFSVTYKGVTTEYDFSKLYEVSNWGRIRRKGKLTERKLRLKRNGYLIVDLYKDGKRLTCLVHRLVAETFLRNTDNKRTVNHIDGNKTNNNVDNLEWATDSEQTKHAYANGLRVPTKGELNGRAKVTEAKVREIRELRATNRKTWTIGKLAKEYGVSKRTIENVVYYQAWNHV